MVSRKLSGILWAILYSFSFISNQKKKLKLILVHFILPRIIFYIMNSSILLVFRLQLKQLGCWLIKIIRSVHDRRIYVIEPYSIITSAK